MIDDDNYFKKGGSWLLSGQKDIPVLHNSIRSFHTDVKSPGSFSGKEVTSLIIEMTCHPGKKKMLGERKQKGSSNRNSRIFIIVGQHLLEVINRKKRLVCTRTSKSRLCSMPSLSFSRGFERECTGQQIVLHQGQPSLRSEAAPFVTCSPSPDRRHSGFS